MFNRLMTTALLGCTLAASARADGPAATAASPLEGDTPAPRATAVGATTPHVSRDAYGVPHIFAPDALRAFEMYGYVVADDRLWQLELNRRAARGRLSEILGARYIQADTLVRMTGYTDVELQAQLDGLPAENRAHIHAYVAGINRYIQENIGADTKRLPYEFHSLGILPQPWSPLDAVAFGVFMLRRFGEIGGREQTNEALLASLIRRFGDKTGVDIFNDVLWTNDPGAPTTIPAPAALAPAGAARRSIPAAQWPEPAAAGGEKPGFPFTEQALQQWSESGVPSRLGSYAWVVNPNRSADGIAMLFGGPQMGTSAPEVVHEVQLHTDDGWNVTGMAFAGVPYVLIGHNTRVAWTSTTAVGDNVDIYRETLCHTPQGGWGTRFRGRCEAAHMRRESIGVRGAEAVSVEVWRTVHGPAVVDFGRGTAVAQKRAHWQHEIAGLVGFARFNRAHDVKSFEAGVETITTQHNFLYADVGGNIAYWQAGLVPVRPAGFDFRLPLPGDGNAEWPGKALRTPAVVNPAQGFLANWNNKPHVDFDSADTHYFGKQSRVSDIIDRLQTGKISWQDMHDIPRDIARLEMTGRQTRFLKAYLMHALHKYPPREHFTQVAARVVRDHDGTVFDDPVNDAYMSLGHAIFSSWVDVFKARVFGDVLQEYSHLARVDLLVRALDIAARGRSTLDMQYRFIVPDAAFSLVAETFHEAVERLRERRGADMRSWPLPRHKINLTHPLLGTIDTIWGSNRATFAQVVRLHPEGVHGESIFTLGQSGRVSMGDGNAPIFDAHYKDQLPNYKAFTYKPAEFLFASP